MSAFDAPINLPLFYTNRGTADVDAAIAAPGTDSRIVIDFIHYDVETAESGKILVLEDSNGTAITVYTIPLTTVGTGHISCYVPLTVNKAFQLNTDGTTGKWSIFVMYHIERVS